MKNSKPFIEQSLPIFHTHKCSWRRQAALSSVSPIPWRKYTHKCITILHHTTYLVYRKRYKTHFASNFAFRPPCLKGKRTGPHTKGVVLPLHCTTPPQMLYIKIPTFIYLKKSVCTMYVTWCVHTHRVYK